MRTQPRESTPLSIYAEVRVYIAHLRDRFDRTIPRGRCALSIIAGENILAISSATRMPARHFHALVTPSVILPNESVRVSFYGSQRQEFLCTTDSFYKTIPE